MTTIAQDTEPSTTLATRKITPAIGAIVDGIDLASDLTEDTVRSIRTALDDNLVLFFEDQQITPAQQRDFAARFGPLYIHAMYPSAGSVAEILVLEYDENRKGHNDTWHSDVTYIETPPQASLLYAEDVPAVGGDTIWLSTYAAYDALAEPLKKLVADLYAVHDFAKAFRPERFRQYGLEDKLEATYADNKPVRHPVVRTNPATGRKALFVNPTFTSHLEGVSRRQSDAILELLYAHIIEPEFQMRWHWKPGVVAFWDNRWTQHYAVSDYFPHHRRMRRATILGDRPI
ncbi:MAG: taurine dioxygenase [Candidatus Eremiobacteraeota bacterium]|nr:taurine dioxygenase [Candidatus Eremiobacteraeota bacterium]